MRLNSMDQLSFRPDRRDTFHRTMGSIERWQHSGGSRWRRSCHSMNRDRAGRCSASASTGVGFGKSNIFSGARRAMAGSMRGITYGLKITKVRCRTRRKIKRISATGSSARRRGAFVWCSGAPKMILWDLTQRLSFRDVFLPAIAGRSADPEIHSPRGGYGFRVRLSRASRVTRAPE